RHIKKGEQLRGRDSSGGGYGDPLTRDPERVRLDVLEGWESIAKARAVYGVVLTGKIEDDSLTVDLVATNARRAELAVTTNGASLLQTKLSHRAGHEAIRVPVQVVETAITPQLASADDLRGAETEPLPHEELLHTRR